MPDALKGQGKAEAAEADSLMQTAQQVGAGALSGTMIAAAQATIAALAKDSGGGVIGEPVADLRKLRTDGKLIAALNQDMRVAQQTALLLVSDALWMGYRTAAIGRTKRMENAKLKFDVSTLEEDRSGLREYPVLGHTSMEIAEDLATRLLFGVNGALSMPLTGSIDPTGIPAALALVSQTHGGRLAQSVNDAYFAGVGAAVRAIGSALTGAA